MSDNAGSAGPGWLHAEGDPAGTHRYWDGSAWQGEPVPIAPAAPTPEVVAPPAFTPPPAMPPPGAAPSATPPPTFAPPAATQAFAPPPTFGDSPPAMAKPKSSAWKWALGVIAVFALSIGACSFLVFQAVTGPLDVGNEFLAAVEAEDFNAAWALADESCFEFGDPAALGNVFAGETITEFDLSSSNVNSTNGNTTGTTSGTVTFADDDVRSIGILASKPNDEWRVCGFDIGAPGSG